MSPLEGMEPLGPGGRGERRITVRLRRALADAVASSVPNRPVLVRRGLRIPMRDGHELAADHYLCSEAAAAVVLVRTPYGRPGVAPQARLFAELGHHVLVQECRGTFESGNDFDPFVHEAADGADTLAWLREQSWCDGRIHTFGSSYVGLTQWALVDGLSRAPVQAMNIAVSTRSFSETALFEAGGINLETILTWFYALHMQEMSRVRRFARFLLAPSRLRRASRVVPVADIVESALRAPWPLWRQWIRDPSPTGDYWSARTFGRHLDSTPPITLVAGWDDLFLTGQLADFQALQESGRPVRLFIGPWTHMSEEPGQISQREALRTLTDPESAFAGPVVHYRPTGSDRWFTAECWPPPATSRTLAITADQKLCEPGSAAAPGQAGSSVLHYDPADPTPSAGGRSLNPFTAGRRAQNRRERRDDVLVFTGDPLPNLETIVGEVRVELDLTSSAPVPDLFLRLTDVDRRGRSRTVTDRYLRLDPAPPGSPRRVSLTLAPTAYRFEAGHRFRLQVSAAAHPLHLRNPGTGSPRLDHSQLIASTMEIRHDTARLIVPLLS